ncbi:MAG: hypothetical protein ACFFCM_20890 [Promethearchaeota archaeon]
MAYMDYEKLFTCPKCSSFGSIFLLKFAGNKLVIKQRCPKHGARTLKIPLSQKDYLIPHIRNGIYRCYKCGEQSPVDLIKQSGHMILIRLACATHGNKLPFHKIWIGVYNKISKMADTGYQPIKPEPFEPIFFSNSKTKFCPNCGSPLQGNERYCSTCGVEIN